MHAITPPSRPARPIPGSLARWLSAGVMAVLLAAAAIAPAVAIAATTMVPACDDVNVRTSPSTGASIKARLNLAATVTVSGSVTGSSWSTACPTSKSGSGWYKITAINGKSVSSAYGVSVLYAAKGVLKTAPSAALDPSDTLGGELTRLVNLDRKALGKPAYLVDARLAEIARDAAFTCPTKPSLTLRGRARDLADRGYFSHTVPGCYLAGTTTPYPAITIVRSVFGYTSARSEILHWNSYGTAPTTYKLGCDITGANCKGGTTTTPYKVALAQRSFMKSSPHRAAQLNSYQRFGCASATVPGTSKTYFACLFADSGPTTATAPAPAPAPSPTTTAMVPACDGIYLRTGTTTTSTVKARLGIASKVSVSGSVTGSAWRTSCPTSKSGSGWYKVTAVNGKSVSSLYGVSVLYAATGVLKKP